MKMMTSKTEDCASNEEGLNKDNRVVEEGRDPFRFDTLLGLLLLAADPAAVAAAEAETVVLVVHLFTIKLSIVVALDCCLEEEEPTQDCEQQSLGRGAVLSLRLEPCLPLPFPPAEGQTREYVNTELLLASVSMLVVS